MLDNWERRHGIWKLHKHSLPDMINTTPSSTIQGSMPTGSTSSHNVAIKFMHDTLELLLTLGHQITADDLPNPDIKEEIIQTQVENGIPKTRRTKTNIKVLHWTLLKIEFTNPSKLMLKQRKKQGGSTENGDDVKLAHYLLLRNLTPSRLADMCPNTKSLEKTLAMISQVNL